MFGNATSVNTDIGALFKLHSCFVHSTLFLHFFSFFFFISMKDLVLPSCDVSVSGWLV